MPMIPPPTSNSTVHRWRVASAAGPPREFSSFIMRILFLPMDKHKTISILRVNQIDGSETIRNRDNKLYGRVKMKVHNQFLLSGVAAIAMLANAAPAMAQPAPADAAPVDASEADDSNINEIIVPAQKREQNLDRKSTRLNSSH